MLNVNTQSQAKSTEKLSSGYQINRAADDAAGLAISEKMRRQIKGLTQASANAQDGISMVQTAEGALGEVHDMLQRINQLSVKGENGTLTSADRGYIASEVQQLLSEIDRVQSTTTFNELSLLDGSVTKTGLQVGAEAAQHIDITIKSMGVFGKDAANKNDPEKGGIFSQKDEGTTKGLTSTVDKFYQYEKDGASKLSVGEGKTIDAKDFASLNKATKLALSSVSKQRSDLGAVQNRLEHTINNLDNVVENTTSAESAIRDTDMAKEMVKYANNNILAQAGQAMLAQANQSNQGVLSLL
jgi:flagellin